MVSIDKNRTGPGVETVFRRNPNPDGIVAFRPEGQGYGPRQLPTGINVRQPKHPDPTFQTTCIQNRILQADVREVDAAGNMVRLNLQSAGRPFADPGVETTEVTSG